MRSLVNTSSGDSNEPSESPSGFASPVPVNNCDPSAEVVPNISPVGLCMIDDERVQLISESRRFSAAF
jgi:hypothetical protein